LPRPPRTALFPYTTLFRSLSAVLASATGAPAAPNLISMTWSQLVEDLKQREDLKGSMLLANKYQKPEIFKDSDGPHKLAEMLELDRKSTRLNSSHVKISYA